MQTRMIRTRKNRRGTTTVALAATLPLLVLMMVNRRGTTTVALAATLPLLVLMMVGAADFARIFYHTITLANASGTAAFYGSQGHIESVSFGDIGTVAAGDARNLAGVTANAELFCDCPTSTGGAGVDCTDGDCGAYGYPRSYSKTSVQQTFELMLPWPGVPNPVAITQQTYTRVQ